MAIYHKHVFFEHEMYTPDWILTQQYAFCDHPSGGRFGAHVLSRVAPTNKRKVWKNFVMVWVIRGQGVFIDDKRKRRRLEPGDLFLHWPGQHHHVVRGKGPWTELSFSWDEELFSKVAPLQLIHEKMELPRVPVTEDRTEAFWKLHRDALAGKSCTFWDLCQWASALLRAKTGNHWLEDARARLASPPFSRVEEVIDGQPFSLGHFSREFKRFTGMTPGAYQRQAKLRLARDLLISGDDKITDIAEELGYADPFTFSKQFKLFFGESPRSARQLQS